MLTSPHTRQSSHDAVARGLHSPPRGGRARGRCCLCRVDADKAGGEPKAKPIVLTLRARGRPDPVGGAEFADALERLSSGSTRIEFVAAKWGAQVNYDWGVVQDVRDGKAQLGIVGVRVWDTLGVTKAQALLAPFLVDSQALQRRVLESPLAFRMLDGHRDGARRGRGRPAACCAGSGSLASLPVPRTIRARRRGSARRRLRRAAFGQALGADSKGYVPGSQPASTSTPTRSRSRTTTTTGWPHGERRALAEAALDRDESRGVRRPHARAASLSRAGREALAPELRQIERDEADALAEACGTRPAHAGDCHRLRARGATRSRAAGLRRARARCLGPGADRGDRGAARRRQGGVARVAYLRRNESGPLRRPTRLRSKAAGRPRGSATR